jgi:flavorubredoxin
MPREFVADMYQIQQCIDKPVMSDALREEPPEWYDTERLVHVCNSAYIIDDERSLLYDTVSPGAREQLMAGLEEVVGDSGLDYVVPSHPEAPHAGNANAVLEQYPGATLLSSAYGRGEELYYLDRGRQVESGETLDLGAHTVEFLEATFPDTAFHIWMKEHTTNTLFTADWMGAPHLAGECLRFADELDSPLSPGQILEFQARALRWLQYADTERVHEAIDDLIQTHHPTIICPAHGTVIREDAETFLEEMKTVVDMIAHGERLAELK